MVASKESQEISSWMDQELTRILGFPSTSEISSYILSMPTVDEQEQYLKEILDPSDPNQARFILEFRQRLQDTQRLASELPQGMKSYKKKPDDYEQSITSSKQRGKGKNSSSVQEQKSTSKSSDPKKTKFVSLYSKDGQRKDVVILKGRHLCECQSVKHDLINNCIKCGRVVCAQEGSGPCLFCGNLVCTKEEMEVLNRGSKKSEILLKKLTGGSKSNGQQQFATLSEKSSALIKAEEHKNKLLEFDENSEKRTQVIDDESDYFSIDSEKWLTEEQRKALRRRKQELADQRHGSRLDRKITFDFAGRKVVEERLGLSNYDPSEDQLIKKIYESGSKTLANDPQVETKRKSLTNLKDIANPDIAVPRPMLAGSDQRKSHKMEKSFAKAISLGTKLQDATLQEMKDDGNCLSMHQPFASLLILGMKKHEGRIWYSSLRGRLWIHAGSKVPTESEIEEVKQFYRMYYEDKDLQFPTNFPTSCLLGSVDIDDVLSQEDYRERYPNGESNSPYVFVCKNPQELLLKLPMMGQHKIYKLDPNIHQAAKKAAKKIN